MHLNWHVHVISSEVDQLEKTSCRFSHDNSTTAAILPLHVSVTPISWLHNFSEMLLISTFNIKSNAILTLIYLFVSSECRNDLRLPNSEPGLRHPTLPPTATFPDDVTDSSDISPTTTESYHVTIKRKGAGFSRAHENFFEVNFQTYYVENGKNYSRTCHGLTGGYAMQFGGMWGCFMFLAHKGAYFVTEKNHVFAEYLFSERKSVYLFQASIKDWILSDI